MLLKGTDHDQKENLEVMMNMNNISPNHHKRYLQSKNNLSFSKKLNSALSTSLNIPSERKEAEDAVGPLQKSYSSATNQKRGSVKSIESLPPIRVLDFSNHPIRTQDHLEIIESACKAKGLTNGGESKSSTGDFVNPLQYLMPLDDYNDTVTTATEKQSTKRKGSKQNEQKQRGSLSRNQSFSKSWPRLDRRDDGPQTLPKIPSVTSSTRHRSMDASKASSGSISNDIAKFNKSRAFRLRNQKASEKVIKPRQRKPLQRSSTVPVEKADEIAIAKVAASNKRARNNTTTTTKKKAAPAANIKKKDLPKTAPSTETDDEEEDVYEEILLDEVDMKCIKWLEDVTRERNQNPDKIFLPHLLMP